MVICASVTTGIYEEPKNNAKQINIVIQNQIVRSLGEEDGFYRVRYGKKFAYVQSKDFVTGSALIEYIQMNTDWFLRQIEVVADETVLVDWLSDEVIENVKAGETFQLKEEEDEFYVVIVPSTDNTEESNTENSNLARIYKEDAKIKYQLCITNFEGYQTSSETMDLVDLACSFVGNPYVWGGNDPATGVDCSGFVKYIFKQYGIELPRVSYEQATIGTSISFKEMKPGDLVFYQRGERIGHVALYIGDGKVVHARGRNYGICITDYDYATPAWARRILE